MPTINDIITALSKPFHPQQVDFRPGRKTSDGTSAIGLAYVDPRRYMDRLDAVTGGAWSVHYKPWGDRIICQLSISAEDEVVIRSSTGEADQERWDRDQGKMVPNPIAGTTAEAQAFKRACMNFGLGRYLYDLPDVWGKLNQWKQFDDDAIRKMRASLIPHYQREVGEGGEIQQESAAPAPSFAANEPDWPPVASAAEAVDSAAEAVDEEFYAPSAAPVQGGSKGGAVVPENAGPMVRFLRESNANGTPASQAQADLVKRRLGEAAGWRGRDEPLTRGHALLGVLLGGEALTKELGSYLIDKLSAENWDKESRTASPNPKFDRGMADQVMLLAKANGLST